MCVIFRKRSKMLEVAKYLPICIILVSSSSIEASKSHEDCDYGDCGQTGYFASGSAYSSQVLLPDGTVVTNSKGSSISSDGVQRTFHELKQEADKYVSNADPKTPYISRNEYADRVPILKVPQNQGVTDTPLIPFSSPSESTGSPLPSNLQQYTEEQKQSSNAQINANSYLYQQFQPSPQDSYQNNLPQESEGAKGPRNVISEPNTNPQPFVYYRPFPLEVPQELLDSNVETDNKLGMSSADASDSASPFQQKIRSYLRRLQDANANIPVYLLSPKASTFIGNGINLAYKNDEVNGFIPHLIPEADIKETHYTKDSTIREQQSEQTVNQYVTSAQPKIPYHVKITGDEGKKSKMEQNLQHVAGQERSPKIGGGAPNNEGRRAKLVIKAKSPSESVGSSQPFRRETHPQMIKSSGQPLPIEMNSGTSVRSVMMPAVPDVPQNDAVAPEPDDYMYVPLQPSNTQLPFSNDQTGGNTNGHGPEESTFHLSFPILLRGVPQNVRIAYPNPNSRSSINHIYERATGSSLNPDGVNNDSASNSLVPDSGNGAPQNVDKHSGSSGNLHYFITNGNVGEQLVPNSDIYVPSDAVIQQNRILQQFVNGNANLNIPSASPSLDTPPKSSYGFSASYSSQSSDVNGNKTENREASVTVNDNGKIESYHVRS